MKILLRCNKPSEARPRVSQGSCILPSFLHCLPGMQKEYRSSEQMLQVQTCVLDWGCARGHPRGLVSSVPAGNLFLRAVLHLQHCCCLSPGNERLCVCVSMCVPVYVYLCVCACMCMCARVCACACVRAGVSDQHRDDKRR